jgi:hypothetical protein
MQEERPLEREVLDPLSCLTSLLLPLDDYENNLQEDALNPLRPSQPKKLASPCGGSLEAGLQVL